MQDAELVPKREVFQLEGGSRLEACQSDGGQQVHGAQNQMEDPRDARQGSMFSCGSRFTVGTIVFLSDQFAMPGQQSLWRDDGGDLHQKPPSQAFGLGGQSSALIVGELLEECDSPHEGSQ